MLDLALGRSLRNRQVVSDRTPDNAVLRNDEQASNKGVEVAPRLEQEFVRIRAGNEGVNREGMLLTLLTPTFKSRVIVFFNTAALWRGRRRSLRRRRSRRRRDPWRGARRKGLGLRRGRGRSGRARLGIATRRRRSDVNSSGRPRFRLLRRNRRRNRRRTTRWTSSLGRSRSRRVRPREPWTSGGAGALCVIN